jgi:hypothetical protein
MADRFPTVHRLLWVTALALSLCGAGPAAAQFGIARFTVDGGGGTRSAGGPFAVGGTIGQPDAGLLAAPGFSLLGGFWSGGVAVTGVEDDDGDRVDLPFVFRLHPVSPNPTRSRTRVAFELPRTTVARVALYDAAGRLVRVLTDGALAAGPHTHWWDRRDVSGRVVAPGLYFLRLDAGSNRGGQKLVVLQ